MKNLRDDDLSEIRAFISSVEWRFAKTMARCPHFYNVLEWNPDRREGFFKLVSAIFNYGYQKKWPTPAEMKKLDKRCRKRIVTYFDIDRYKYWVMSSTIEEVELINRAKLTER